MEATRVKETREMIMAYDEHKQEKNGFVAIIYWRGAYVFYIANSFNKQFFSLRWIYIELLIKFSDEKPLWMSWWKVQMRFNRASSTLMISLRGLNTAFAPETPWCYKNFPNAYNFENLNLSIIQILWFNGENGFSTSKRMKTKRKKKKH